MPAPAPGGKSDQIASIGAAYMRFAVPASGAGAADVRLRRSPTAAPFPELGAAADGVGEEIGKALDDAALGVAVWGAVHGLAMLVLEDVIDLGQRRAGLDVLPSRAEILLRSLLTLQAA